MTSTGDRLWVPLLCSDEECLETSAFRTVEIPDGKQEDHFDIKISLRAEHRKELEEILEGQSASAVVTEYFSDTAREWIE